MRNLCLMTTNNKGIWKHLKRWLISRSRCQAKMTFAIITIGRIISFWISSRRKGLRTYFYRLSLMICSRHKTGTRCHLVIAQLVIKAYLVASGKINNQRMYLETPTISKRDHISKKMIHRGHRLWRTWIREKRMTRKSSRIWGWKRRFIRNIPRSFGGIG